MKHKKLKLSTIWLLSLLLFGSCEHEITEKLAPEVQVKRGEVPEFQGKLISSGGSESPSGSRVSSEAASQLNNELSAYRLFELDVQSISSYVSTNTVAPLLLSLGDSLQFDLVLESSNIISPDYQSTVLTASGEEPGPSIGDLFYKGHTSSGGSVRLMLDGNTISGVIREGEDELNVKSTSELGVSGTMEDHIIVYRSEDFINDEDDESTSLAVEVEEATTAEISSSVNNNTSCSGQIVVEIATFASYDRYADHFDSNVRKTNLRIIEIINEVENNFDEFDIRLEVVEQQVATCGDCVPLNYGAVDPVLDEDINGAVLEQFGTWAKDGGFKKTHDVGILFIGRDVDPSGFSEQMGFAYDNSMCYDRPYGMIKHMAGGAGLIERTRKVRIIATRLLGTIFGAETIFTEVHLPCRCIMALLFNDAAESWADESKAIINVNKHRDCLCEEGIVDGWLLYSKGSLGPTHLYSSNASADGVQVGDFNGDGKADVLKDWGADMPGGGKGWYISYGGTENWVKVSSNGRSMNNVRIGDFDGDGEDDVLTNWGTGLPEGPGWYVSYSATTGWNYINNSGTPVAQLKLGDFNGDGITDVMKDWDESMVNGKGWYVCYGNAGRNRHDSWVRVNNFGTSMSKVRIGDFDGDGADDVLTRFGTGLSGGPGWYVSESSQGHSNWKKMRDSAFEAPSLRVGDFNGDGISDIFAYFHEGQGAGKGWYVSYSATQSWVRINQAFGIEGGLSNLRIGDFDGDNVSDVFYTNN